MTFLSWLWWYLDFLCRIMLRIFWGQVYTLFFNCTCSVQCPHQHAGSSACVCMPMLTFNHHLYVYIAINRMSIHHIATLFEMKCVWHTSNVQTTWKSVSIVTFFGVSDTPHFLQYCNIKASLFVILGYPCMYTVYLLYIPLNSCSSSWNFWGIPWYYAGETNNSLLIVRQKLSKVSPTLLLTLAEE